MRRTPSETARAIIDGLPKSPNPLVVALDGRSGTGRSTAAAALRDLLEHRQGTQTTTIVEGDTFYGGGSAETWDRRTPDQNVDAAFDWRRQREVLQVLRRGEHATWHSFDWHSPQWDTDAPSYEKQMRTATSAEVSVLEGVYAARPENSDLIDMRVLIDVSDEDRQRQLEEREGATLKPDWESRWAKAEDHYFAEVITRAQFDIVVSPDADGSSKRVDEHS